MINPGSRPVEDATEEQAEANLSVFIDEATERGLTLTDEPIRHPEGDADGRFAWLLPLENGPHVLVKMPGSALDQVHEGPAAPGETAQRSASTYCIRVGESWWWWTDAVGAVVPREPGLYTR